MKNGKKQEKLLVQQKIFQEFGVANKENMLVMKNDRKLTKIPFCSKDSKEKEMKKYMKPDFSAVVLVINIKLHLLNLMIEIEFGYFMEDNNEEVKECLRLVLWTVKL